MSFDTSTLLGVRQNQDYFVPFLVQLFFPNVVNSTSEYVDFDELEIDETLAPLVSPYVAGNVSAELGKVLRRIKPAYVKPKDIIRPDHVIKRRAGEQLGGVLSPGQRYDATVVDLLNKQERQISRREEWMAAEALINAQITLEGENYPAVVVDYGRNAANTITLVGTDVWSDTVNATPLDDLEDWNAISDAPITDYVMNSVTWKKFKKHQEVKDMLDKTKGLSDRSQLELGPDNEKWASFKGYIGTYAIWVYDGWYKNAAGVKVKFVPDNLVIGGSNAIDGVLAYGAILDKKAGFQSLSRFPKMWEKEDPAVEYVMTQSAPMAIPVGKNSIVVATVD